MIMSAGETLIAVAPVSKTVVVSLLLCQDYLQNSTVDICPESTIRTTSQEKESTRAFSDDLATFGTTKTND